MLIMKLLRTGTVVLLMLTLSLSGCLGRGGGGDGIDGRVPSDVKGDDDNVLYTSGTVSDDPSQS